MKKNSYSYECPAILFLIFNRPDLTTKVFEKIRESKPKRLFIAADGPRKDHPCEDIICAETRRVIEAIDWPCEIQTLFRENNLGCKEAVSSAISWFFEHVDEGIILEDDCLPDPSFFRYCQELLEMYRNDSRIMAISGDNFQQGRRRTDYSYYFSRYNHCWGWASWRRAWKHWDGSLSSWPEIKEKGLLNGIGCGDEPFIQYWRKVFDLVYNQKIDTWDYQWTYACWIQNGLSIIPNKNLVSNIGFGPGATHTQNTNSPHSALPTAIMAFPLKHPPYVIRDNISDQYTEKYFLNNKDISSNSSLKSIKIIWSKMLRLW